MYYRYEIRFDKNAPWEGITSYFCPTESRMMTRWLKPPKWYGYHPDITDTECWFTEYGYEKYKNKMQELIDQMGNWRSYQMMDAMQIRIRKRKNLPHLLMNGKVQCICRKTTTRRNNDERQPVAI